MNNVILTGRLTKEIEVRVAQSGVHVAGFTLAVNRILSNEQRQNGAKDTDFINCVAFSRNCDVLERYAKKGDRVLIQGSIQTRDYTNQENKKVYITEVLVNRVELLEKRVSNTESEYPQVRNASCDYPQASNASCDYPHERSEKADYQNIKIETDDLPFY